MKKITALSLASAAYISTALPAFAAETAINACPDSGGLGFFKLCGFNLTGNGGLIPKFITLAFVIAVLVALVFLIYGGIRWITSGGDKSGVESARNIIVAALVGLVVVFLAYFILNFVLGLFGLGGIQNLAIPQFG